MIAEGVPVVDFHREERRLEDAFVDMIKQRNP
jgi:ABC-2 type transport system ATP-binding protein